MFHLIFMTIVFIVTLTSHTNCVRKYLSDVFLNIKKIRFLRPCGQSVSEGMLVSEFMSY